MRADLSDLTRPRTASRAGHGPLREVYLGIPGPGRERLLFETYLREGAISAESRRVWGDVIPSCSASCSRCGWSSFRSGGRCRRRAATSAQREALHQAVTASEHERRRLARDLHDGVVQDLVAVSLSLGATQDHETGSQVRRAIRRLRTLLVELYPDDLHRQGLEGASEDLLAPCRAAA